MTWNSSSTIVGSLSQYLKYECLLRLGIVVEPLKQVCPILEVWMPILRLGIVVELLQQVCTILELWLPIKIWNGSRTIVASWTMNVYYGLE
jgi:hypothetical protein